MKHTCKNCQANLLSPDYSCLLGYKKDHLKDRPLEYCPKPLNKKQLNHAPMKRHD